jgi:hypothetical protein
MNGSQDTFSGARATSPLKRISKTAEIEEIFQAKNVINRAKNVINREDATVSCTLEKNIFGLIFEGPD